MRSSIYHSFHILSFRSLKHLCRQIQSACLQIDTAAIFISVVSKDIIVLALVLSVINEHRLVQ